MCIVGLGHASLVQVWEACREDPKGPLCEACHKHHDGGLCEVCHDHPEELCEACNKHPPEGAWDKQKNIVVDELEHINLVVRFYQSLDFDRRFMGFDCDFWPRLVCSFPR